MFYFCRCWATRVSIQMQMSCRCCSRQLLRPLAEGERAGRAAGTATLLRAGAIHTKPSGPPGPCKGVLFGLVVCKRLCSPPRPARKPEAQRYFFISSSTCRWLPERNCSNSAARSPLRAHGSLPAGRGYPEAIWGFFPSPDRYLCKSLNIANC